MPGQMQSFNLPNFNLERLQSPMPAFPKSFEPQQFQPLYIPKYTPMPPINMPKYQPMPRIDIPKYQPPPTFKGR
jgi:hypothetical protein